MLPSKPGREGEGREGAALTPRHPPDGLKGEGGEGTGAPLLLQQMQGGTCFLVWRAEG